MLDNSSILITGGTGSFGHAFAEMTLNRYKPKKLVIFSRDELKQWEMEKLYANDERVRFFIGDVRDKDRLHRALDKIDYVIHAAATKIVPIAEYNPFEAVKTNVLGAMNLIDASIDQRVKKVIALSTDKASSPINLYGATKLTSDKLFIASNSYSGDKETKFAVVRYGNVMGSRGSIIPFFLENVDKPFFPITHKDMTRFMITLEEGVNLVWDALKDTRGGEIYVKKIPSMRIIDIAKAVNDKKKIKVVGIRPGEKLHEQMISVDESQQTYEYKNYYKILPALYDWNKDSKRKKNGKPVPEGFSYSSDKNNDWMEVSTLKKWIFSNFSR